jgi:hypothetical protein
MIKDHHIVFTVDVSSKYVVEVSNQFDEIQDIKGFWKLRYYLRRAAKRISAEKDYWGFRQHITAHR